MALAIVQRRRPRKGWRRAVAAIGVICLAAASPASADEARFDFNIPPTDLSTALVKIAVTAKVSIGMEAVGHCAPQRHAISGRMTMKDALDRLLAGTGCSYRSLDPEAIEIVRSAPRPQRRPQTPEIAQSEREATSVLIVAGRHGAMADRLAYGLSVLDRSELGQQGVQDTAGLALLTPAMTVTNLGVGRDKVLLRGLSDGPLTGQTESIVGLYLDDVRLTYNAPNPDLRLSDIDHVEVLRGPQGTLYGAGSLGGIVQAVTAPPDPARIAASVTAMGATASRGAGSQSIDAMINAPFLGGRGAARLVVYREIQGGYINDVGLGLSNINQTQRSGGRLAVRLDLDPRWRLTAGVISQGVNDSDTQYALANLPPFTRSNQLREPHDNDFSAANLGLTGNLGWGEWRSSIAVVRHGLTSRYDASTAPPVPTPSTPAAFDDQRHIDTIVADTTLASAAGDGAKWLVGVFSAYTRQSTQSTLTALGGAPVIAFNETRHDQFDELAAYGEVTVPLNTAISLTVGGRLSSFRTRVWAQDSALGQPQVSFVGNRQQQNFTPKAVLAYALSDRILVYAQAAEGYRAGGFNTTSPASQVFSGPGGAEPSRRYDGDELWSLETGAKLSDDDGRWRLRVAAFRTFWKDIQSDQLLPSGLPFTANIGAGVNSGVEAEGRYRLGDLDLDGQVLFNAPELTKANPSLPPFADFSLAAVPDFAIGVSGHYAWRLPRDRSITLDGRLNYIGQSQLILDQVRAANMGDYTAARIAASFAGAHLRWTLAVDNPTDERANTFGYGNPFTVRTTRQVTPLRPRTLSLELSASF